MQTIYSTKAGLFLAVFTINPPFNVCIKPNKIEALTTETINVKNCGDELPSMIQVAIDWGDGTAPTNGLEGAHQYKDTGVYLIRLFDKNNGVAVSEIIGTKENIEHQITIK